MAARGDARSRVLLALLAWPPIGFAAASLLDAITGCAVFSPGCTQTASMLSVAAQPLIVGALVLVPMLAAAAAFATVATLLVTLPLAAALSALLGPDVGMGRGMLVAAAIGTYLVAFAAALFRWERPGDAAAARRGSADMSRRDPADISAAAQEYLLALRVMASDGRQATASQVGRHLGVSTQASSEMFKRLTADGLVTHPGGRDLVLTPAGRAAADAIFRRHALLEWLLTSVVGLGWAESDEEAGRLQGAISPRVEAKLDELLGHPETCPHGNPIDAETARRRPPGIPPRRSNRVRPRPCTDHRGGGRRCRAPVVPRGPGADPRRPHHDPRAIGVAGFAHARRSSRPGDPGVATGGAHPRPARRGRPGPLPPPPGTLTGALVGDGADPADRLASLADPRRLRGGQPPRPAPTAARTVGSTP